MSRVAKNPVAIPKGVDVTISADTISVKGAKGSLTMSFNSSVNVKAEDGQITFAAKENSKNGKALAGTTRALVANMVLGVTNGFQKKLELVGVGYKAQAQGKALNLNLGYSHPIVYQLPEGVTIETPSQTEILIKGIDKQQVGQVAAEVRAYRSPEPYKGKGVRYSGEKVRIKEAKKK
ncbi:MAG: 50S ribosomal protein L6 [Hahellaceae bacterium]|nr:50S ribosomal protein L6 [Hahellaceae bacterium]